MIIDDETKVVSVIKDILWFRSFILLIAGPERTSEQQLLL